MELQKLEQRYNESDEYKELSNLMKECQNVNEFLNEAYVKAKFSYFRNARLLKWSQNLSQNQANKQNKLLSLLNNLTFRKAAYFYANLIEYLEKKSNQQSFDKETALDMLMLIYKQYFQSKSQLTGEDREEKKTAYIKDTQLEQFLIKFEGNKIIEAVDDEIKKNIIQYLNIEELKDLKNLNINSEIVQFCSAITQMTQDKKSKIKLEKQLEKLQKLRGKVSIENSINLIEEIAKSVKNQKQLVFFRILLKLKFTIKIQISQEVNNQTEPQSNKIVKSENEIPQYNFDSEDQPCSHTQRQNQQMIKSPELKLFNDMNNLDDQQGESNSDSGYNLDPENDDQFLNDQNDQNYISDDDIDTKLGKQNSQRLGLTKDPYEILESQEYNAQDAEQ